MSNCPSDEQLVRMVEGALGGESLAAIEAHVDSCDKCSRVIAELGHVGAKKPVSGTDETALASRAALSTGGLRTVGRYQLDRRIAAGGMGEVWAAWDPKLERDVAIKLVKPDRSDDGRERTRLLREARALAKLMHPNVLAVHDVGEQDGEVFLATELVPGDTLASRGGASSDWRALARLYVQAARGLAAAHAVGLVHRDVKPANLLVGADGRVRVGDFGLAVKETRDSGPIDPAGATQRSDLRQERDPQVTAPGAIAGTPAYMAPEQRLGVPPDARCDQYALCVALVEGICGRRPSAALEPAALIDLVSQRRAREPELDALLTVLARGLEFEPEARFASMGELADAIEDVVGTAPIVAGSPRAAASTSPPPLAPSTDRILDRNVTRSRKKLAIGGVVGGAAVLAAASAIAFVTVRSHRGDDAAMTVASGSAAATLPAAQPIPTSAPVSAPGSAAASGAAPASGAGSAAGAAPSSASSAGTATGGGAAAAGSGRAKTAAGAHKRVAAADDPTLIATPGSAASPPAVGSATAPTGANGRPPHSPPASESALDAAWDMLQRRDAGHCAAAYAAIDPAPLSNRDHRRLQIDRELCEMISGHCAAAQKRLEAIFTSMGEPLISAKLDADDWCSPSDPSADAETRKKRLFTQVDSFPPKRGTCDLYVKPVREYAAKYGATDGRGAAILLTAIAKCMSIEVRCDEAHKLLAEAQKFIPKLDASELTMDCR